MATHLTSELAKQDNIVHMGEELGSLYSELWQEVSRLFIIWGEYVALYGTKPSRVDLINNAAPLFFKVVQVSLWDNTLLAIARITDPTESCRKKNLTIKHLPSLIKDMGLQNKINNHIKTVDCKATFCRDYRNRRLAHNDFDLMMSEQAKPLEPASRKNVIDVLKGIMDVMNTVSIHFMETETPFDHTLNSQGAEDLLYVLDNGLRASTERRLRLESGNPLPNDTVVREL